MKSFKEIVLETSSKALAKETLKYLKRSNPVVGDFSMQNGKIALSGNTDAKSFKGLQQAFGKGGRYSGDIKQNLGVNIEVSDFKYDSKTGDYTLNLLPF